jgi:hypothetical protein
VERRQPRRGEEIVKIIIGREDLLLVLPTARGEAKTGVNGPNIAFFRRNQPCGLVLGLLVGP